MGKKYEESEMNMLNLDDRMDVTVGILKNIASRNIVSNSHAILELIKNGFDEDSTEVLVKFIYENGKISEVRVIDEGYGFTESGFNSFKLVGKSQKIINVKTPLGRITTGMYGSGAYSTIKLGNYLKINSANYEKDYFLNKEIDWSIIYKNPDKRIRELIFKTLNQFKFSENSGTQLIIRDIHNSFDLKKIMRDLLYITIRSDFVVKFVNNGKLTKTVNFIDRLNDIKPHYDFVTHIVLFSYLKGKIMIELDFSGKKELWEIRSSISDFQGKINGKYLSIDKKIFNKKKNMFLEFPLFKGTKGTEALNLFYNNEMLVLTDEILGLDLQRLALRQRGSYGFRNSLGYTAVQETNLIFNESRTSITDDLFGQYQKYKIILDEIFGTIKNKIINILNSLKSDNELNNINEQVKILANESKEPVIALIPKITTITIEDELLEQLKKAMSVLNKSNSYYRQLMYCISELQRMLSQKDYIINFSISFYAVVRVYCEILFIYKIYDFFDDENDLNKVINICQHEKSGGFKSLGGLLRILMYNHYFLVEKLSQDFRERTNQIKLDSVESLVKKINNHIHKPNDKIEESIVLDLIRIFTKWL
ncbi:MAG: ATP-binding protein [Spiroplasma sp.]